MHYWLHRLSHFCRFFWAVHVNHHSSPHYNFSVGFRSAVLEPFYNFLFLAPLALCGFQPADILLVYAFTEIWAVLTHTEKVKKLGWLEYIMVTPSHHRVHHASNPKYLDKNMGSFFIFWDKLFGTFQKEMPETAYQPIKYGLTSPINDITLSTIIFHEWSNIFSDLKRKDIGWKEKWRYLFGPPGWSHDGSRLTSDKMREKEEVTGEGVHFKPTLTETSALK
jgi:sterol desaturase/sphingolipid hydroxylase (fatty acid hydroxylase superfamily)